LRRASKTQSANADPKPAAIPAKSADAPVPASRPMRQEMLEIVRQYVADKALVPPLAMEHLQQHARNILAQIGLDEQSLGFTVVLLNNELWRNSLAATPYSRRLLLLPQCLRDRSRCKATIDEFGLLCSHCGSCDIHYLQSQAQRLGYVVLVAEGSTMVMSMIESGQIDAIIGVSCLPVLEQVFPYMHAAAIPGLAIPLLKDGCIDTQADMDWIWEAIYLSDGDQGRRMDLIALRKNVESWFTPQSLSRLLGRPAGDTDQIAMDYLAASGKRWRPFLALCAAQALSADPNEPISDDLRRIAIAVECFHKASLIHDDIEDDDDLRDGVATLHRQHGLAVAINIGDLLLGEGYRMIGQCTLPSLQKEQMLQIASQGHRNLCLGQGAELWAGRGLQVLSSRQVLDIFQLKTAPAFEVALRLGAIYSQAREPVHDALVRFSQAIGIAYQIKDDLEDFFQPADSTQRRKIGPSVVLATMIELAQGPEKELLVELIKHPADQAGNMQARKIAERLELDTHCRRLLEQYRQQAVEALDALDSVNLRSLLRRVSCRMLSDIKSMRCCREYQAANASDNPNRDKPSG
jgi:geranylgeranyl diphosphate synthase type II